MRLPISSDFLLKNNSIMQAQSLNTFDNMYNTYSRMLYGFAIEISPTQSEAEQIFINTFYKAQQQDIARTHANCLFATLIKLTMQTAREELEGKITKIPTLSIFRNTPLLHMYLCENVTINEICKKLSLTLEQTVILFRKEVHTICKPKPNSLILQKV